jgi:hypothetical protein
LEKVASDMAESDSELDSADPLTIPEAKRRLALTLGIEPDAIEITVKA